MTTATDDDFPVLSDVLDEPAPIVAPAPETPPADLAGEEALDSPLKLSGSERDQLEQAIRANIMRSLQNRVDVMLQFRIEETVQELVGVTVATLSEALKESLKETMADVVQRAVSQELSRLLAQKKK